MKLQFIKRVRWARIDQWTVPYLRYSYLDNKYICMYLYKHLEIVRLIVVHGTIYFYIEFHDLFRIYTKSQ